MVTGSCHYCDHPAATRDHVIPWSLGGPTCKWNLVPACYDCNHRKGARTYESFTGRAVLPLRTRLRGFDTTADFLAAYPEPDVALRRRQARSRPAPVRVV
jgi:5-methylcytosine-specific restriction endonuclease McrA